MLTDNKLDILIKEVLDQFNISGSTSGGPSAAPVDVQAPNDDQLKNARLKKKEVRTRSSLRRRMWLDPKQKGRIRIQKKTKVYNDAIFLSKHREKHKLMLSFDFLSF